MAVWLTPADVASIAGTNDVTGNDALDDVTAAAAAYVERVRPDLTTGQEDPSYDAPADVKLGAAMLGARLYERRGSLLGAAASIGYDEAGAVVSGDPDIERLLQVGRHRPFGFGSSE